MLKRLNVVITKESDQKEIELANWVWGSHSWIEHYPGYFKCEWCDNHHTSTTGISAKFPLCKNNPAIKDLIEDVLRSGMPYK